jgi:hypothetical protein
MLFVGCAAFVYERGAVGVNEWDGRSEGFHSGLNVTRGIESGAVPSRQPNSNYKHCTTTLCLILHNRSTLSNPGICKSKFGILVSHICISVYWLSINLTCIVASVRWKPIACPHELSANTRWTSRFLFFRFPEMNCLSE